MLKYMRRAMELAENGRRSVSPNPVVGCVLVRDGKIIAEDWHREYGKGHAERNLLGALEGEVLPDDVLMVTLEPCCHQGKSGACTDIILEKGVKKVVVGVLDPNPEVGGKGVSLLREMGLDVMVMESSKSTIQNPTNTDIKNSPFKFCSLSFELVEELIWQNRGFFTWVTKRRPWVTLKMAQSLDGRITPEKGQSYWLTGPESREHVHKQRAQFDAILVGVGTVMVDNPMLTVRLEKSKIQSTKSKNPRVVVLDAALSVPLESEVMREGTMVFRGRQFKKRLAQKKLMEDRGVVVIEVDTDEDGYLNLRQILDELAAAGMTSLYVEGGPRIWSSFLNADLVDEVNVYLAPEFLGNGEVSLPEFQGSSKKIQFKEWKQLGDDVMWRGLFVTD